MLSKLYEKYGDDPLFRDAMESFFRNMLETKKLTPEQLRDLFGVKFLPEQVREMVMEDIEEAQEALELKKYLEENEDKVYKFLTQVT